MSSRRVKAPARRASRSGASQSGGSSFFDYVSVGAAVVIGVIVFRKMRHAMQISVAPDSVALVYDARRRTVFSMSTGPNSLVGPGTNARSGGSDNAVSNKLINAARHYDAQELIKLVAEIAQSLIFPAGSSSVTRPPLPFYKMFVLPRTVLTPALGATVTCLTEAVPSHDHVTKLNIETTVKFYVDVRDLPRYLSTVGPEPPHSSIAKVVGSVLRANTRTMDSGVLLSKQRRTNLFKPHFEESLQGKLLAKCCVRIVDCSIENVEEVSTESAPGQKGVPTEDEIVD